MTKKEFVEKYGEGVKDTNNVRFYFWNGEITMVAINSSITGRDRFWESDMKRISLSSFFNKNGISLSLLEKAKEIAESEDCYRLLYNGTIRQVCVFFDVYEDEVVHSRVA